MDRPCCFIVGAGDFDGAYFSPAAGDLVIAADGGYAHLTRLGVVPDIVLGDFDSLDAVPDHPCVLRHPTRKDDTDMGLALKTGLERGYRSFALFGGLGGARLDHTLANIQSLAWLCTQGARGMLVGGGRVVAALENGAMAFRESCRGFLSVFCHGDSASGVFLRGLKYPLDNAALSCRFPLGVSNEFLGIPARVEVERGLLIVTWQGGPEDVQFLE